MLQLQKRSDVLLVVDPLAARCLVDKFVAGNLCAVFQQAKSELFDLLAPRLQKFNPLERSGQLLDVHICGVGKLVDAEVYAREVYANLFDDLLLLGGADGCGVTPAAMRTYGEEVRALIRVAFLCELLPYLLLRPLRGLHRSVYFGNELDQLEGVHFPRLDARYLLLVGISGARLDDEQFDLRDIPA